MADEYTRSDEDNDRSQTFRLPRPPIAPEDFKLWWKKNGDRLGQNIGKNTWGRVEQWLNSNLAFMGDKISFWLSEEGIQELFHAFNTISFAKELLILSWDVEIGELIDMFRLALGTGAFYIETQSIITLLVAVFYLLNPMDVIPDSVPVLGWTDDIVVLNWTAKSIRREISRYRKFKASRQRQEQQN